MVRGFLATPPPNDIAYSPASVAKNIAEGLAARGHEVTFFGPEGTSLATNIETLGVRPFVKTSQEMDDAVGTTDLFGDYRFGLFDSILAREMLERANNKEFDCVVFHHFESSLPLAKLYPQVPVIYILHDHINEARKEAIDAHASDNQYFISISDSQRRDAPDLNYAATVYNGVDIEHFEFEDNAEEYLMFSGRIVPEKGVKEAIQAAIHTHRRLLIAGILSSAHHWYFDEHVKPFLNDRILYLGMLDKDQLVKYYKKSAGVLMPIQWQEPFGLVMAEANACGTPVIAFNRGAVPEVIAHEKTGYIVDNSAEMIMSIEKLGKIKRRDCRAHVEKHFTTDIMVNNYEKVLSDIIATHTKPTARRSKLQQTFKDSPKKFVKSLSKRKK